MQYLDKAGLDALWAKIKNEYVSAKGGVVSGDITLDGINTGSLIVRGDARFIGAVHAPTFTGNLVGNASTATKATQDADGNVFTSTYATKTQLTNGSVTKVGTSTVGGTTTPIYLKDGVPTALSYTIAKSVPSNAVFTDTWRPVVNNLTSDSTDSSLSAAQGKALKALIDALPTPMQFKGSLGTGGTITSLPTASTSNEGYTYKVITNGTYASQAAKIGDVFISNGTAWVLVPSGDEPSGTVTSVGVSVPTGLSVSNTPITTSGTIAISLASDYSIPTTTKQAAWDAKQDAITTSNKLAYSLISGTPTSLPASDVSAWAKKSSLAASDVPTLAISKIDGLQTALDGKLNLSGGTMTGVVTLTSGSTSAFDKTALSFVSSNGSTEQARIGTDTGNGLGLYAKGTIYIRPSSSFASSTLGLVISNTNLTYNGNAVYHTGNKPTKSDVGLGNVDNTADANKSVNYANELKQFWQTNTTVTSSASYFRIARINCGHVVKDYNGVTNQYAQWIQSRVTFLFEGRYIGSGTVNINAETTGAIVVPTTEPDPMAYYVKNMVSVSVVANGTIPSSYIYAKVCYDSNRNVFVDIWVRHGEYNTSSVYCLGRSSIAVSLLKDTTTYSAITSPDYTYYDPAFKKYVYGTTGELGNINPVANNTYSLGTTSLKWANVYATTFVGALSGNAATASNCNYSGAASASTFVVKRTDTNGGAFIRYYSNNQETNYWQVGSIQDTSQFIFSRNGTTLSYIDSNGVYNGAATKVNVGEASATSDVERKIVGHNESSSLYGIDGVTINWKYKRITATTFKGALDGNAATVTNGVYTTGNQTIGGTKTFSNTISGNISGSAGSLATSRTLWGQSFNGTANVSGDMTGVGSITASGNIQSTKGVSALGIASLDVSSATGSIYVTGIKLGSSTNTLIPSDGIVTLTTATSSADGIMSKTDKAKLDAYPLYSNLGYAINDLGFASKSQIPHATEVVSGNKTAITAPFNSADTNGYYKVYSTASATLTLSFPSSAPEGVGTMQYILLKASVNCTVTISSPSWASVIAPQKKVVVPSGCPVEFSYIYIPGEGVVVNWSSPMVKW